MNYTKKVYISLCIFSFLTWSFNSYSDLKEFNTKMAEYEKEMRKVLDESINISEKENNEFTAKGIFPKCEKGDTYQLGLCYEKCENGWEGIGPRCFQDCRKGFNDLGITCTKMPNTTKKPQYNRGIGSRPICPSSKDTISGLCFDKCKKGYTRVGMGCRQKCPSGYKAYGYLCYKRWFGVKWRRRYKGIGKLPNACSPGKNLETGLCYSSCKKGYSSKGPLCSGKCPDGHNDLGLTCVYSGEIYGKTSKKRKTDFPIYSGIKKPKNIRYIKDNKGRSLILHGINSSNSSKKDPLFMPWVTEKDVIQETKTFGLNAVRLLIFWAAVEPKKGEYDQKYLERVAKRVKWYTDNGAWVILDMHQDIYGYAVGGNGAPAWATDVGPYEEYLEKDVTDIIYDATKWEPVKKMWWLENINPATMEAYKRFWDYETYPYLQDHYLNAWKQVVKKFKDNPKVLGYDLMNEPHHPDIASSFEKKYLNDFYKRIIRGIREIDNDKWIFFEPSAFGVNFGRSSKLEKVQDVRSGEPRIVYAPHMYPILMHESVPYSSIDRKQVSVWSKNRSKEVELHRAPLWVGEIGADERVGDFNNYIEEALNMFDYMGASWMWWSNSPSKSWGLVDWDRKENEKLFYLIRAYPRAVAGHPISYSFDVHKAKFFLKFQTLDRVTGETEIFIPKRHYPNGYKIKVFNETSGTTWKHRYDDETQILYLKTGNIGTPYTVLIERK